MPAPAASSGAPPAPFQFVSPAFFKIPRYRWGLLWIFPTLQFCPFEVSDAQVRDIRFRAMRRSSIGKLHV